MNLPCIAFVQNSRDEVRLQGGDGDQAAAVNAEQGSHQTTYVAFSCKDHGADAGDVAPTLRGMGFDGSHANGGGQVAVMTLAVRGRGDGRDLEVGTEGVANTLVTPNGGRDGMGVGVVAFAQEVADPVTANEQKTYTHEGSFGFRTRNVQAISLQDVGGRDKDQNGRGWNDDGTAYTVDAAATQGVATTMQVRRLTPTECLRLQGFPDDYLSIAVRGKPAADGPKYRAVGNSMAVPCIFWIGRQIERAVA